MLIDLKEMLDSIENFNERIAFMIKDSKDSLKEISYSSFVNDIKSLGTALINLELKDKHIAVLSENRYEWIVSYLAAVCGTGVIIPIDRDLPDEAILYLLESGNANAVLYSETYDEIIKKAELPSLKYCICFDKQTDENEKFLSYNKTVSEGRRLLETGETSFTDAKINKDEMACILFTSGTTGFSKGVMLSHKNIASNIIGATSFEKFGEHETMLSVLPYHHSFEATVGLFASLTFGATICINDSLKYLSKNMTLFKPTAMFLVPAIIYAIYKRIQEAEKKLGRVLSPEEAGAVFGGRLTRIFSGSAPLKPELIKLFKNYGIKLCQGYGLTETSPVVSTTDYNKLNDSNISSVGQVIPGCEVKIKDNEILVRGDNVMLGYYNNPSATNEVFEDGWFKTGDLGYFDNNGFLYINGRKKNVIIASGGENVYPEEIEQFLYSIPYITDAMVYGGENKDCVTAVIYPNYDIFVEKSAGEIKAVIDEGIQTLNEKLPVYKQILAVKIRKTPFEKTTSNKVKRNDSNTQEV